MLRKALTALANLYFTLLKLSRAYHILYIRTHTNTLTTMKHLRILLLALCAALVLSPASAALSEASSVDVATMQTPPKKAKDKDKKPTTCKHKKQKKCKGKKCKKNHSKKCKKCNKTAKAHKHARHSHNAR